MAPSGGDLADRVKSAVDIVEVARGYFPLTQRGERFWALCPFHPEKTPSFSVNPGRQIFACFGCKKSGDVLTLVMEMERLTFREALRTLAERAGIPMPDQKKPSREEERRLRLLEITKEAAAFYSSVLASPAGKLAREYLLKRGFSPESIKKFGLGYAPDDWRTLLPHLKQKGFSDSEVVAAGLAKAKDSGTPYDLLRNRVIIPIRDPRGRVIAFGGRVLDASEPKYLNTPETELFSKRTVLFGMERARMAASARGSFVVVEGYMDALAAHQHGLEHVVATLGTALTREHARAMRQITSRVVLLFDADEGGRRAADRGAPLLLQEGMDVRIASLPDQKDPDEYLQAHGAEAFGVFLDTAGEDLVTFLIRRAKAHYGVGVGSTAKAAREVLGLIGSIEDPIGMDVALKRIATEFGVDEQLLRKELPKAGPAPGATRNNEPLPVVSPKAALSAADQDELAVLLGLMTDPFFAQHLESTLCETDFRDAARRRVFMTARAVRANEGISPSPSVLQERLRPDREAFDACSLALSRDVHRGDSVGAALERLVRRRDEVEYRKLRAELNATRGIEAGVTETGEMSREDRLLAEMQRFHAERHARSKSQAAGRPNDEPDHDPNAIVKNQESGD